MKVRLISTDERLVETVRAACAERDDKLTVVPRMSASEAGEGLTLIDLDVLDTPADLDPEALSEQGPTVLVGGSKSLDRVDAAVAAVVADVLMKPASALAVNCRLATWAAVERLRRDRDVLASRVDELAIVNDRRASALEELEARKELGDQQHARLEQVMSKLEMVTRLSRLINCLDLQTIVEACIERVPLLVEARFASLYFHDQRSGHLVLERHNHPWKIAERVDLADVVNSPMSLAIQRKKLVLIRDFEQFEASEQITIDRGYVHQYQTGSCIIAPLMSGHRIIGVLNLADKVTGEPFDEEIDLPPVEQLCELIGASIYNIELFREVERQAKTDGLTGLANHRTFMETLARECERARRYDSNLAMLMIDMDRMKEINDSLGHQAGDVALEYVAAIIRESVRVSDIPARYGGDEFAVILVETSLDQAKSLAQRLQQNLHRHPLEIEDRTIALTLSVGVGEFRNDPSPEHFIKRIDTALYDAKGHGRNRVVSAADESNSGNATP